jgi:muconolactone delta-isomerase
MKIIAIEKMLKDVDAVKDRQLLMDEARTAWRLQQEGSIRELHFHNEERKAVLIMEAESAQAAKEILDQLPLVSGGYAEFEIIPLRPYDGFARLFAE